MSDDLKDILSNLNKEIEQDKLLDYLNKKLPASEAHEVEKQMADDDFMNDAVEGLEKFNNKKDLGLYVQQLNHDLQKQLNKKNKRREKRKLKRTTLGIFYHYSFIGNGCYLFYSDQKIFSDTCLSPATIMLLQNCKPSRLATVSRYNK